MKKYGSLVILIALFAGIMAGCGGKDTSDPKQVVINMFGAMEKNDKAALTRYLDLAALMKNTDNDYAFQTDSPRVFTSPQQILDDLTGNGQTKRIWFQHQRIINKVDVLGDNATVEVTFMNKQTMKAYLTKFGLHKDEYGRWKIYSFSTENPS